MSQPPAPPAPTRLLRAHAAGITALSISDDNERILSGDSSGLVVVSSTRSLRPIASWNAHTASILAVEEFGATIITHGRDNKLHIWNRIEGLPLDVRRGGSATLSTAPAPTLAHSMDVNALNYCRFYLLRLHTDGDGDPQGLIALPNLVDSSTADIWTIPGRDRLHAAIGQEGNIPIFSAKATTGRASTGIIMAMHLHSKDAPQDRPPTDLRLLCAYESGTVTLRRYTRPSHPTSIEGQGWEVCWTSKSHVETIMSMAVSSANTFALSVSADHLVVRYELSENGTCDSTVHRIKHAGNSCVAIRDDGRVCAVGGWDGCIRLFSTKSFKPLGTLKYHSAGCQALVFAHDESSFDNHDSEEDEEDGDLDEIDKANRSHWLMAGSKDSRLSVWTLIDFSRS